MRIKPFAALRPPPERAAAVAAVPYDVVDTAEARALAAGNPDSFLRISRSEIDLPDTVGPHDDAVYAQAARVFRAFQERGVLARDPAECFYLYRQVMGAHSQTGVVVCCHLDDYANNVIRKHEKTRQDKEDDRTRHCLALNANSGPVFLTCRDTADLDAHLAEAATGAPLYDFVAADGVRHTVWRIAERAEVWIEAFRRVPLAYVADGHHRAAAAYRAGLALRNQKPDPDGTEEYNWFLAVIFPASRLQILPYNRCVADLNGLTATAFLRAVADRFDLSVAEGPVPAGPGEARLYLEGCWRRLAWPPPESDDPVSRLDVSILQNRLLAPILGIADPRTDTRISFVGGIRGAEELARRVDSGQDAVAFSMAPVSVAQMMAIADAGQIMPPKSTWFEPKLRSGLFVHTLS